MNYFGYLQTTVQCGALISTAVASVLLFRRWPSLSTVLLLGGSFLEVLTWLGGAARPLLRNLLVTSDSSERAFNFAFVYVGNSVFMIGLVAFSAGLFLYALSQRAKT